MRDLEVAGDLVCDEEHRALVPRARDPVLVPFVKLAAPRHNANRNEYNDDDEANEDDRANVKGRPCALNALF